MLGLKLRENGKHMSFKSSLKSDYVRIEIIQKLMLFYNILTLKSDYVRIEMTVVSSHCTNHKNLKSDYVRIEIVIPPC